MKGNWSTKTTLYFVFAITAITFMIYSLISLKPDEIIVSQGPAIVKEISLNNIKKETFELLPLERDPFFGTTRKKRANKTKIVTKKKDKAPWPNIRYNGMIENGKGTNKLFVVFINNSQQLLENGSVINGVKLVRGNSEKITVSFHGETKEISQ